MTPPRRKTALLTWIAIYPLVTLLLWLLELNPLLRTIPLPITTLILTVILVSLLTWVVMPAMYRIFRRWLVPAPRGHEPTTVEEVAEEG